MRKVKILKILGIILLLFSVGAIIYRLIESIAYNINGWYLTIPGPALFKWYEIFCFNMWRDIVFIGPIFILGVVLLYANRNKKVRQIIISL